MFLRHTGKAAFVGPVHYAKGTYVGVVMDDAQTGKNNGKHTPYINLCFAYLRLLLFMVHVIQGVIKETEYFKCPPGTKGLMVPLSDVLRL